MSSPDEEVTFKEVQDLFYEIRRTRAEEVEHPPLSDDAIVDLMVQVADLANACEIMFLRLCVIRAQVEDKNPLDAAGPNIGLKAFERSSDGWKRK